jgi:hypothetical protein
LLTTDAVLKLLEDKDPPKILLGLLAFDRLQPLTGVEKLDRLQSHSDPNVAKMATRILEKLAGETLQAGLSILQPFDDPQDRADVLRWMIKDKLPVNERMVTALQAALEDRDWQVRMTAVVACVRLGVRELGPAVSKVHLPKTSWEGCDSETRRRLREIHRASLHLLAGAPPEDTHPARNRLFRALAGLPVDEPDELSWLVDQLATPRPEY